MKNSPDDIKKTPVTKTNVSKDPASAWKNVKIDPSQLSFSMGRPLSEEEFKNLCASRGMTPQIHRVDSSKK